MDFETLKSYIGSIYKIKEATQVNPTTNLIKVFIDKNVVWFVFNHRGSFVDMFLSFRTHCRKSVPMILESRKNFKSICTYGATKSEFNKQVMEFVKKTKRMIESGESRDNSNFMKWTDGNKDKYDSYKRFAKAE